MRAIVAVGFVNIITHSIDVINKCILLLIRNILKQRGMGELAVSGGGVWGGTRDLLENVLYQKKMVMLLLLSS